MVQSNKPINLSLIQSSDHLLESDKNKNKNMNMMKKSTSNISREVQEPRKLPPPNYMRPTTSSDAKKDSSLKTLRKTTSFKSPRISTQSVLVNRDTCSSILKDSKFPAFLELNHGGTQLEGTSVFKVCHYTYCSLNGLHHHKPPLPPLDRFISSKRQILKTQSSTSPPLETAARGDHRPEIVDVADYESEQAEVLDLEKEEGQDGELHNTQLPEIVDVADYESEQAGVLDLEKEEGQDGELHNTQLPEISGDSTEKEDDLEIRTPHIESDHSEDVEGEISHLEELLEELDVQNSIDELIGQGHGHGHLEEANEALRIALDLDLDHMKIVKSDKRREELDEEDKGFNPKQPNYLAIESEPESEKVDLRHQELDEKKNSEEWMLDYAIQQAVNKLSSARKKRVGLLVEAFEKVTPIGQYNTSISSSPVTVSLNHSRPIIQACI